MVWGGLFNFAMTYVFIAVTLRLVRAGVHPAAIGAVDAIAAAAGLVGAFGAPAVLGRTRIGVLTVTTGLALALVIVPMAWTTNVVAVGALLALGMLFVPANNAGISAYVASVVPDHLQGRVNSASGFVATGLSPIAPVVAGAVLASTGGVTTTLVGAALVAASVLPIVASRSTRSLGRPGSWSRDVTLAVPTSPP
jgi:hypothetical protein